VLWKLLKRLGVPDKLLALIIAIHDGAQASVRVNGELLEQFRLESGLKQGSIFAPLFFNIFFGAIIFAIDSRLEKMGIELRFRVGSNIFKLSELKAKTLTSTTFLWACLFADDAAIFAKSEAELQKIISVFNEVCSAFGQEISFKKTEVMVVEPRMGGGNKGAGSSSSTSSTSDGGRIVVGSTNIMLREGEVGRDGKQQEASRAVQISGCHGR
jgi:hypothetical protein